MNAELTDEQLQLLAWSFSDDDDWMTDEQREIWRQSRDHKRGCQCAFCRAWEEMLSSPDLERTK